MVACDSKKKNANAWEQTNDKNKSKCCNSTEIRKYCFCLAGYVYLSKD